MLDKLQKNKIIGKFKTHAEDTGSTAVQIAILTEEIKKLTEHLTSHKQDHSSRRGLLRKVGQRRRLLLYLSKEDHNRFVDLCAKLKIKMHVPIMKLSIGGTLDDQGVETEEM